MKLTIRIGFLIVLSTAWASSLASEVKAPTKASTKKIVLVGDSLTEGYGVAKERAYPSLLQKRIEKSNNNIQIVNSGISGSTAASAPSRVKWALKQNPFLIVLALGANDGLRGTPVANIEANLRAAVQACKAAGVKILLVGMQIPPNYGLQYSRDFAALFPRVAKSEKVDLLAFLLEGVAGDAKLNLADGIHPNERGHERVAETVYKALQKYL